TDASSSPVPPVTIHRTAYRPPEWRVPEVALDFALGREETRVPGALSVVPDADAAAPLVRRRDALTADAARGGRAAWSGWRRAGPGLGVGRGDGPAPVAEAAPRTPPAANRPLTGPSAARSPRWTQCEAGGARRVAWPPDRPGAPGR